MRGRQGTSVFASKHNQTSLYVPKRRLENYCFCTVSYYYYSSSSSSRRELVRPISQRLMIRSLLNFTGRWIPISRSAIRSWNFQNGRRCHGNREHMSQSLTSLISETAKGISTRLVIYIKQGWQNILTKENRERMAAILKIVADKSAKFQCSLISMKIDIQGYFEVRNCLVMMKFAIQCHFQEATIFKMAANKIVKLSMVSDFNEH